MADQMIGSMEMDENKDASRQTPQPTATTGGNNGSSMGGIADASTEQVGGVTEQARNMVRNLGDQARSAINDPSATAQDLARRAREQAATAGDMLYQQGSRAGEYLSRNINEYPFAALLIAGAIGYGLAYLIHGRWQSWDLQGWDWQGSPSEGATNGRRTQR